VPPESTPRHLRIAALQPSLSAQAGTANMVLLRRMVEDLAADAPLDVVVLPEAFDPRTAESGQARQADQAAGARQFLRHLARACSVNVIGGSMEYPVPPGRPRNSCFVVDRQGNELGRYDKRVLFSHEADRRSPGEGPGIFDFEGLRVGVLICGDLWRPELARELLDSVDLVCVPAMTAVPSERHVEYARALWFSLALTRAMENALAVAVSDWADGRHDTTFSVEGTRTRRTLYTCGAACICDPGRRPEIKSVQRCRPGGEPCALRAEIDLAALAEYRKYRRAVGLLPADSAP
jgi:predicted amidohydrolase